MPAPVPTAHIETFRAATDGTAGVKELPARLLVGKWGDTDAGARGMVRINEVTAARMPGMQAGRKYDRVALDFQHATLTPGQAEPIKVAGYGTPRVIPGEGLWLEDITYTPEGRDVLPGGHYPDLSPAVERLPDGTVIFLHSVGAVRQGELPGLVFPFSASFSPADPDNNQPMKNPALIGLIALLAKFDITLAEDATDEQITAAVTEAQDKPVPEKKTENAPPVEGFTAVVDPLVARITALEAEQGRAAVQAQLDLATAAGKVVGFSVDSAMKWTAKELKDYLDGLPAGQVPMNRPGHDLDAFRAGTGDAMHPEQAAALATLGFTPEEVLGKK